VVAGFSVGGLHHLKRGGDLIQDLADLGIRQSGRE